MLAKPPQQVSSLGQLVKTERASFKRDIRIQPGALKTWRVLGGPTNGRANACRRRLAAVEHPIPNHEASDRKERKIGLATIA